MPTGIYDNDNLEIAGTISGSVNVTGTITGNINATCLGLSTVTVTSSVGAGATYTTNGNVILLADTTAVTLQVNLTVTTDCPNSVIIIKKIDTSANFITITPPAGETINGTVSHSILLHDEVVMYVRDSAATTPDWTVASTTQLSQILTTKGEILTRTATSLVRLPAGTPGQFLAADNTTTTGLRWQTGSFTHLAVYAVLSTSVIATNTIYTTAGCFSWMNSRYSGYTAGVFIFYATVPGPQTIDVQIIDVTNGPTVLGTLAGIAVSGAYSIGVLANPSADAIVEVQVRRSVGTGANPSINGGNIEYQV